MSTNNIKYAIIVAVIIVLVVASVITIRPFEAVHQHTESGDERTVSQHVASDEASNSDGIDTDRGRAQVMRETNIVEPEREDTRQAEAPAVLPESETAKDLARGMFDIHDAEHRAQSIRTIRQQSWGGQQPYLKSYRMLIYDHATTVRVEAIRALAMHGETTDRDLMATLLDDANESVRSEAQKALANRRDW